MTLSNDIIQKWSHCYYNSRSLSNQSLGGEGGDYRGIDDPSQRILKRISEKCRKLMTSDISIFDQESGRFRLLAPEKVFIAKIRDYQRIATNHYHDDRVQEAIKSIVPWKEMTVTAAAKAINLSPSRDGQKPLDIRDLVLFELVEWFKGSFFSWFNKSVCDNEFCLLKGLEMEGIGSGQPTLEDLSWEGSRVELYKCSGCGKSDRFPRYNHPLKLLTWRRGRCGEWANTFTAICTALGYDCRLVLDWTDHVWTEVWSEFRQEWIHVDSCEGAIDTPLLYENGWDKKLTYCIAVSRHEIQDVTFRYTSQEPRVFCPERRKDCQEEWLVGFIVRVNHHLQRNLPETTKRFMSLRTSNELINLLWTPWKQLKNFQCMSSLPGRQSGSDSWRRERGELGANDVSNGHSFVLRKDDLKDNGSARLSFNLVSENYKLNGRDVLTGWKSGVFESTGNLFKKVEQDWKMVYLARPVGCPADHVASISWRLDLTDVKDDWSSLIVFLKGMVGGNGQVDISIAPDVDCNKQSVNTPVTVVMNQECVIHRTDLLPRNEAITGIMVTVKLVGGSAAGVLAWQKAQLFRQSLVKESEVDSFVITISR